MSEIKYYLCSYNDYPFELRKDKIFKKEGELDRIVKGRVKDKKLSKSHSLGYERQNLDGTRFITWCDTDIKGEGYFNWMSGDEPELNHDEIRAELKRPEWYNEALNEA